VTKEQTNKPSWDDAPEWAQWLAQDENGYWYWHKECPTAGTQLWASGSTIYKHAAVFSDWKDSLEQRPAPPEPELEPCPFCGGPPVMKRVAHPELRCHVECDRCGATSDKKASEALAAFVWNNRT
jgi:Lar family restriction alleviation protein